MRVKVLDEGHRFPGNKAFLGSRIFLFCYLNFFFLINVMKGQFVDYTDAYGKLFRNKLRLFFCFLIPFLFHCFCLC